MLSGSGFVKRFVCAVLVAAVGCCAGAQAQRTNGRFDPFVSTSVFVSYTDESSQIVIGGSQNQRLLELGGSWNVREHTGRFVSWRYEAEVIPAAMLSGPHYHDTQTISYLPGVTPLANLPAGTYVQQGLSYSKCFPASGVSPLYDSRLFPVTIVIGSVAYSDTCSVGRTYGAGLSPLGQRMNLFPHSRVQPYGIINAGFMAFTRNVPVPDATRFNFTAQGGGGVEWYEGDKKDSWTLDVRYHHLSNAFRGETNPGIDNWVFRIGYNHRR
jgi:hypothetical protein